jgi:hypothetical protein
MDVLYAVIIFLAAMVGGGLFSVQAALVPSLRGLPADASVRLHQIYGPHIDRVLPASNMLSSVLGIIVFAKDPHPSELAPALTLGGIAAMVTVVIISTFGNIPINKEIESWPAGVAAPEHSALVRRWGRLGIARSTFALASLACYIAAAMTA